MSRGITSLSGLIVVALSGAAIFGVAPGHARAASALTVSAPTVSFAAAGTIRRGNLPITVSWPKAVRGDAPIARYVLQRRTDGGSWRAVTLAKPLVRFAQLRAAPWKVHEFRVRAIDDAGNQSAWSVSAQTWPAHAQEADTAVALSDEWSTVADTRAHMWQRGTTSTALAKATFTFVGNRVAWVASVGPDHGSASVSIDGGPPTEVSLVAAKSVDRRVVFKRDLAVDGPHTLEIIITSDGPAVDVDSFLVMGAPKTQTLVGAGDISRCDNDGDAQTAAVVAGVDGIVYTTGDNVYHNGTTEEFATCYEPTWGAFKSRTRPSPGNHDYGTTDAAGYYDYFGAAAGDPASGYYAYEAGTWRVYSLNSERCGSGNNWCRPGSAQYEWLAADLNANAHRCVAAYWHRPIFSTGPHGGSQHMAAIFELLYNEGADVVMVGHDHTYERFAKARPDGSADPLDGIRQFVIGTGGAALYDFSTISPLTEVRDSSTHGVLRMDLQPGAYAWDFMPAGEGTFTDSGTAACH